MPPEYDPPETPVNPPMDAAPVEETVNPPMDAAPPGGTAPPGEPPDGGEPEKKNSISSDELTEMLDAGFKANRKDWESEEVNLTGAGPQPLDDSAFGGDD